MNATSEILYTGSVAIDRIESLIADCHFMPEALFLGEQLPDRAAISPREQRDLLRFTYFNQALPFAAYPSGRIFYERKKLEGDIEQEECAELRWERQGDKLRAVYLGSQGRASVLNGYGLQKREDMLSTLKQRDTYYYLFGERLKADDLESIGPRAKPGDFAVVRIPHILRYPVKQDEKRYVRLAVREYIDATGRVALFRLQRLETDEGAKRQ